MDEHRIRGSPKLQFTKEELEDPVLAEPVGKTETTADLYDTVRKRVNSRYRLKPAKEDVDTNEPENTSLKYRNVESESESLSPDKPTQDICTDIKAPGVQNTRNKPNTEKENSPKDQKPDDKKSKDSPPDGVKAGNQRKTASQADEPNNTIRLKFEDTQAKKPSRLLHPVEKTVRSAGDQLHRQVAKANDGDNVAVDALLQADSITNTTLQTGEHAFHAHRIRKAHKAEKALDKANIRILETKTQQENPQFTSNPYSRWQQKRAIKKEYAAAKRGRGKLAQQTAKKAEQAVEKTGEAAAGTVSTIKRHPRFLTILALGALLMIVINGLQSCVPLAQTILESLVIGSYPAKEEDVLAAENAYLELERALKDELEHYDRYHPDYDEYHVEADEIWHDPYVLAAIISACFDGEEWDLESAMPVIERYFHLQYVVTETVTTRSYRDDDGVLQRRTVCTVTMENRNLSHLPVSSMTYHTLGMYALYMSTHGNMEGIFSGPYATPLKEPMLYEIPQELLDDDPSFAKLMDEAIKYIGYPYVWGGSDPKTSFDCSGFICYVFTASGIRNTGRLGAKGIRSLCRDVSSDKVRPGDIVFFDGTMGEDVEGVTHCGIYVGNNMMIHCGSPIGYADLTDPYWHKHFHSYGRIPH